MIGLQRMWPYFVFLPDDVFLVSFPKSGNTWVRFLIANLLCPDEDVNFGNIDRLIPESEQVTKRAATRLRRPRIMKSHHAFDPRFPRVIYIVRDPRDVAVSQYHFYRKRRRISDDYPIQQFVSRFIAGTTSDYGSWGQNVASWVTTSYGNPAFQLLHYEDLIVNTSRELAKMVSFLDIPATPDALSKAVQRSSPQQMRKLESPDLHCSVIKGTRGDIPFVRSANAGGWKAELPESSVAELERAWSPLMEWLGYSPVTCTPPRTEDELLHVLLGKSLR